MSLEGSQSTAGVPEVPEALEVLEVLHVLEVPEPPAILVFLDNSKSLNQ